MSTMKKTALSLLMAGFALPAFANQVNVNTASKDELMKGISGLSAEHAQAIIDYRNKEGAIVKLSELVHVGLGPDIIGPNYNKLTVGDVTWADKKDTRLQ